jgi:sporulation protein YlmC with PRC-barrel domain
MIPASPASGEDGDGRAGEHDPMRLELRQRVRCTDDVLGELADVIVDPNTGRVTHLVVQPRHGHARARLVPVELAECEEGEAEITLRCSIDEARGLSLVEESAYVRLGEPPLDDPDWDVGLSNVLALPYSPMDPAGAAYVDYGTVSYDRIPKGDVEIQHTSAVVSADGHDLGRVEGFLIDGDTQAITHVVLERGHLWGRRDVTIPVDAIASVGMDEVRLTLDKAQVGQLPTVRHRRP